MRYIDISFLEGIIDGNARHDYGSGVIVCLISILMVFIVLFVIIGISAGVSKIIDKFLINEAISNDDDNKEEKESLEIDVNDEDQMVAILVSSIDYRNEIKKDVKVVRVREVK